MHRQWCIRCAELDVTSQDYVVCTLEQALDVEADRDAQSEPQEQER
jgi:hypothetical protein